ISELINSRPKDARVFGWSPEPRTWKELPFSLPGGISTVTSDGRDAGLRFVDLDEDGHDDIVFSNAERFGVYLFNDMQTGWSRVVVEGMRSATPDPSDGQTVPKEQRDATPHSPPLRMGGEGVRTAIAAVT